MISPELIGILAVGAALATLVFTLHRNAMKRIDRLEDRLESRFDRLEDRVDRLDSRVDDLNKETARIGGLLDGLREAIYGRATSV